MKIETEQFESGWIGMRIMLTQQECASLRGLLHALETGEVGHFHAHATDYDGTPGIADVEFSLLGAGQSGNAALG